MTIVRTWIEDFSSSAERSSALSGSYSRVELGSALQILIGRFSTSPVIASSSRNLPHVLKYDFLYPIYPLVYPQKGGMGLLSL